MGYSLESFICRQADSGILAAQFDKAISISLDQGLALIPMTEELFDQINAFTIAAPINKFEYLNENIELKVLKLFGKNRFAYVEALYHGGEGGQMAIIWNEGKREVLLSFDQERINQVLKSFGVRAAGGHDEFVTLQFNRFRNTEEWINNNE